MLSGCKWNEKFLKTERSASSYIWARPLRSELPTRKVVMKGVAVVLMNAHQPSFVVPFESTLTAFIFNNVLLSQLIDIIYKPVK